jgi:coenzyme F420-reducing hydrogenase alpha subunit
MEIKIEHISKIEGHAGFIADIAEGRVKKVRIDIQEGARLLEGILRDRNIYEASQISARICGVCPVVHTLTSLKTLEGALGIEISPQTELLRKIMMMGQIINSHALHLFFFSLPDFLENKNDLDLIKKHPQRAKEALLVREFGNELVSVIGGRSIHPLTPTIGGFLKMPDRKKLEHLFISSEKIMADAKNLAKIFNTLSYPRFVRPAPYASLHQIQEYAFYDGLVKTPSDEKETPADFLKIIKEYQLENSVVKRAQYYNRPFMVGAISRLNNNHSQLNSQAKQILKEAKIHLPSLNPFHNIVAQAVEIVHCVQEARELLQKVLRLSLENNIKEQNHLVKVRLDSLKQPAFATGAIEAPRGTLYYFYEIGKNGKIINCNIITPTSQNMARLEADLEEYLPSLLEKNVKTECDKNCQAKIKMLVRAYDPCLTCATH